MLQKNRLCTSLDFIGTGALVVAIAALSSRFWFHYIAEPTLFSTFLSALVLAVSAFLLARVVQLTGIVIDNPNARARRVLQIAPTNLATVAVAPAAETQATDFQRAA